MPEMIKRIKETALSLGVKLQDFQLKTIITLVDKKNIILMAPEVSTDSHGRLSAYLSNVAVLKVDLKDF